jgi:hypothetical protein
MARRGERLPLSPHTEIAQHQERRDAVIPGTRSLPRVREVMASESCKELWCGSQRQARSPR